MPRASRVASFRQTALLAMTVIAVGGAVACGALFTDAPSDGDIFDAPLPELTANELAAFVRGDQEFARQFSAAEGLGPLFNDVSCAACHSGDGRGDPRNMLVRIGEPGDGYLTEMGGPQIQTRALPGVEPEQVPLDYPLSLRLPPPVFGMGLIEAIPDAAILANVDSLDINGDGISGRPNWVTPHAYVTEVTGATRAIGRFGRKAQTAFLLQQVVEAYHQDMGITSTFRPHENVNARAPSQSLAADRATDPEITNATVESVVHYVRTLAPPAAGRATASRTEGDSLFMAIGCASCHVPTLRTGNHRIAALTGRDVALYSDLLLHDMGDQLADRRTDGDASGREWRTAPLWGTRLAPQFLDGKGYFMHDGRARTIDEAVRMHGGEGSRVRAAYLSLTDAQRAALIDYVSSR